MFFCKMPRMGRFAQVLADAPAAARQQARRPRGAGKFERGCVAMA
jgi:hypothetical protein